MKIIQDVVWNHTGNFGENTLSHMFDKQYDSIQDLGSLDCMKVNPDGPLAKSTPNYSTLNNPDAEYAARLNCMKTDKLDTAFNYHHSAGMDWSSPVSRPVRLPVTALTLTPKTRRLWII